MSFVPNNIVDSDGLTQGEINGILKNKSSTDYRNLSFLFFHKKNDLNNILSLSSTVQYSRSSPFTISNLPTVSAKTITDNAVRVPRQLSISGVVVIGGVGGVNRMSPTDFVEQVELLRDQKQLLSLSAPNNLSFVSCFITKFDCSADVSISNGLRVEMTFDEITELPQKLGKVSVTTANDKGSGKKTSKGSVTSKTEKGNMATSQAAPKQLCTMILDKQGSYQGNDQRVLLAQQACRGAYLGKIPTAEANATAKQNMDSYSKALEKSTTYKSTGGNPNKRVER